MYKTIIIGRDLSSLIAALTSVREGRRTILLMEGDTEIVYRDAGYTFPYDPRPLSALVNRRILADYYDKAEVQDSDAASRKLMDPAFQVILPGHRVDIFHDREKLISDLIREYPAEEREIKRFYSAIMKTANLVARWIDEDEAVRRGKVGCFIRQIVRLPEALIRKFTLRIRNKVKDDSFRMVVEAQLSYLSHFELEDDLFSLASAYLLSLPIQDLFYQDGLMSCIDRLRLEFTNLGGITIDGCSVIRIETDPVVTVDLESDGCSSTLKGEKLIVSSQWEKLEILLPGRKILPTLNRLFAPIHTVSYPFCLHMGVHKEGLPDDMAPYVILSSVPKGPVTSRDLIFLQTSFPGETDRAPEDRRAIIATVYLAESPLRLSDQSLKETAMGIIDSLDEFLPFLRESIDYLRVDQSISCSRGYQEMVNRKYRSRRHPLFGMKTLTSQTHLQNVLLTGGILRPGLGYEGEILAGMDAVFQAQKRS